MWMSAEHDVFTRSQLWLKMKKNSSVACFLILPDKKFMTLSRVIIYLIDRFFGNCGQIDEFQLLCLGFWEKA